MAGKPFDDKAKARLAKHIISGGKTQPKAISVNESDDEPDADDDNLTHRKRFLNDHDDDNPNNDGSTAKSNPVELPAVTSSGTKKSRFADRFAKIGNKTGYK
jgi:hypothetical protein